MVTIRRWCSAVEASCGWICFQTARSGRRPITRTISSWSTLKIHNPSDDASMLRLQTLEQFTSPPGGGRDNLGRRVWPTAIPLLDYLLRKEFSSSWTSLSPSSSSYEGGQNMAYSNREHQPTVLELGAGCGVVGMGLACLGFVRRVLLTDYSSDWLQRHVDKNQSQFQCPVEPMALPWGRTNAIHWKRNTMDEENSKNIPLDYIVGSDLLYDEASHQDLIATLDILATRSLTKIVFAYPCRADNETNFMTLAKEADFIVNHQERLHGMNLQPDQDFSVLSMTK